MLKVIGIDRAAQHVDKVADIAAAWLRDLNRGIMASQARRQSSKVFICTNELRKIPDYGIGLYGLNG